MAAPITPKIYVYGNYIQPNLSFPIIPPPTVQDIPVPNMLSTSPPLTPAPPAGPPPLSPPPPPPIYKIDFTTYKSHYIFDYILIHYNEFIKREINNDKNVVSNEKFVEFWKWTSEFERILEEARNDPSGQAMGPFGGPTKSYSCVSGHNWNNTIKSEIKKAINNNSFKPNVYTKIFYKPFTDAKYIADCNHSETANLVNDVIKPTEDAYQDYITSKLTPPPQPLKETFEKFSKELDGALAEINEQVKNGDYNIRYTILEEKIKDIVAALEYLASEALTESNIVKNTTNFDYLYEDLQFNKSDMDGSLIVPTDSYDLVSQEKMQKELAEMSNKYKKLTTSSSIASAYSIKSTPSVTKVSSLVGTLQKSLKKIINIENPSKENLELIKSKIYLDPTIKKFIAKYLSDVEVANLIQEELKTQKQYLDSHDSFAIWDPSVSMNIESRTMQYQKNYPNQLFGGTKKKRYQFAKRSTQRITISQTGGREIVIPELVKNFKDSEETIKNTKEIIQKMEENFWNQNELYFKNKDYIDIDRIIQKNNFLILAMNMVLLYNFLISEKTDEHLEFFNEMKSKIKAFKNNLTNIWDIMGAKLESEAKGSETVIKNLLNKGTLLVSDIQNLFKKTGLNPDILDIDVDEMLNQTYFIKMMTALTKKYGIENTNLIMKNLQRIYGAEVAKITEKGKSMEEIYQGLYQFYSDVKSVNDSINSMYNSLDTTVYDFNELKKLVGDIIDDNLKTANMYLEQIILQIQKLNVNYDLLSTTREQITSSKRRLNDFRTFLNEKIYFLQSKETIITKHHIDQLQDGFNKKDIHISDFLKDIIIGKNIYGVFLNNYASKIRDATNNITKNYRYTSELDDIKNDMNLIKIRHFEFEKTRILLEEVKSQVPPPQSQPQAQSYIWPLASLVSWAYSAVKSVIQVTKPDVIESVYNFINIIYDKYPHFFIFDLDRIKIPNVFNGIIDTFVLSINKIYNLVKEIKDLPYNYHTKKLLVILISDYYIRYAKIIDKYKSHIGENYGYSGINIDGKEVETYINKINKLKTQISNDDGINAIITYLFYTYDYDFYLRNASNEIKKDIKDLYNSIWSLYGLSDSEKEKFDLNNINQLGKLMFDIIDIAGEFLVETYEFYISLITKYDPGNVYLNDIYRDTSNLSKIPNIGKMYNVNYYYYMINNLKDDLVPKKKYDIPNTNIICTLAVKCLFYNIRYEQEIFNLINRSNMLTLNGFNSRTNKNYLFMSTDRESRKYIEDFYNNYRILIHGYHKILETAKWLIERNQILSASINYIRIPIINIKSAEDETYLLVPFTWDKNGIQYSNNTIHNPTPHIPIHQNVITGTKILSTIDYSTHVDYSFSILLHSKEDQDTSGKFKGLIVYIPAYDNDNIIYNSTSGVFEYQFSYHELNGYTRSISITEDKYESNLSDKYDLETINNFIKIIKTIEYSFEFIDKLYPIVDTIKKLELENHTTWDKAVTPGTNEHYKRSIQKGRLLEVLDILLDIQQTIRNNKDTTFGLKQVLLENNTLDVNNKDVIYNAKNKVLNQDPQNNTFNLDIYKIWIFTRKLVCAWYSIFGHILTNIILKSDIIYEFITDISNQIINKIASFKNTYKKYIENEDRYYQITKTTIEQKLEKIVAERNKFPVNIEKEKNTDKYPELKKYIIDDNFKKIVSFNNYYYNIGKRSEEYYILMALMNDKGDKNIKPYLIKIDEEISRIINISKVFDKYMNKKYVENNLINKLKPIANYKNYYELIDDLSNNFYIDIGTSLHSINETKLISDINNDINSLISIIKGSVKNSRKLKKVNNIQKKHPKTIIEPGKKPLIPENFDNIINTYNIYARNMGVSEKYIIIWQFQKAFDYYKKKDASPLIGLLLTHIYIYIAMNISSYFKDIIKSIAKYSSNSMFGKEILMIYSFSIKCLIEKYKYSIGILNKIFVKENNKTIYAFIKDIYNKKEDERNNMEIIIINSCKYTSDKQWILDIHDAIIDITNSIKNNLHEYYDNEKRNYEELLEMEKKILNTLNFYNKSIDDNTKNIKFVIDAIYQVMFNEHYKKMAFIENNKLLEHLEKTIKNYETTIEMIKQKIYDIETRSNENQLRLAQFNNHASYKILVNKLIQNKNIVDKVYKQMSFGVVEYYYDVLDAIIYCLENKRFVDMSDVESYLYIYHYITIKRCHKLFEWIRLDYIRHKQDEELKNLSSSGKEYVPLMKKKIQLSKTKGDVGVVFIEFQGIREYLDKYNAIAMDKVQVHLRINDFVSTKYNDEMKAKFSSNPDYPMLLDNAITSDEYQLNWKSGKILFSNYREGNTLDVNFDILKDIDRKFVNPTGPAKDFKLYYNDVYSRMEPNRVGIPFNRIYNSLVYPDSDVISNYMSIAQNILNYRGTVIMTYGYSGVGKSDSLFGRKGDPSRNIVAANGILQSTMDQFSDVEIYFRVFEIYGLGTQYNSYWNRDNECYPEHYQCVIHHVLDNRGDTLKIIDQLVFTNKHDILQYILDFRDPARVGLGFEVNNIGDPNLGGKGGNYNTYFDPTHNKIRSSTFVKITEKQYHNFSTFVNEELEKSRSEGVTIRRLFNHLIKRVKGTINNPVSSRSILVYDFEVALPIPGGGAGNIYVPFLIYDLPGKEDISRTFIDNDVSGLLGKPGFEDQLKRMYRDINGDQEGVQKNTYILNPILMPTFGDNVDKIVGILKELSSGSTGTGYKSKYIDGTNENDIIDKVLNTLISNFGYQYNPPGSTNIEYTDNISPYYVSALFDSSKPLPNTMIELFDMNKFDNSLLNISIYNKSMTNMLVSRGIASLHSLAIKYQFFNRGTIPANLKAKEIYVILSIVLIAYLINYSYYDLIVEIINQIVEDGIDDPTNGKWSISKIYSFFESYYINENVVGLLQYLIKSVLKRDQSGIKDQITINKTTNDIVSENIRACLRYRIIYLAHPKDAIREYGFKIESDLLKHDDDPLKEKEIVEYIGKYFIDRNNGYYDKNSTISKGVITIVELLKRISGAISLINKRQYNDNNIFRSGDVKCALPPGAVSHYQDIINPMKAIDPKEPDYKHETNRPLLQDFLEPYMQKINFVYLFYVVTNGQIYNKGEEQVKLLNNSMKVISVISDIKGSDKKKKCAS